MTTSRAIYEVEWTDRRLWQFNVTKNGRSMARCYLKMDADSIVSALNATQSEPVKREAIAPTNILAWIEEIADFHRRQPGWDAHDERVLGEVRRLLAPLPLDETSEGGST